ncbi:MAG: tRNA dihydrouridine synthase [Kiritimatiellia bacterium]|jgi:tRNA-dihydrouridine synthase B
MSRPVLHLAPMADVSDAPMRAMSRRGGADVCTTEMVCAEGLVRDSSRTRALMTRLPEEGPLVVQLYGGDPGSMAAAAEMAEAHGGFVGIDVNAGCPVPKVLRCGAGAALLRDPARLGRLVAAMKARTALPVTVKTRIGSAPGRVAIFDIIRAVEDAGGDGLAIHGRFASAGHVGPVDHGLLRRAVEATRLPVVVNGGVNSAADALALFQATGAAGIMVGRGAMGNPWLFGEIAAALEGAPAPSAGRTPATALAALQAHLALAVEFHEALRRRYPDVAPDDAEARAVASFRLHLFNYFKGFPGVSTLRRDMARCRTVADVVEAAGSLAARCGGET